MIDFIGNFIDKHPWISSVVGAIIIYLCLAAAIGIVQFILWLNTISTIASAIIILFPLLVIFIRVMISS